MAHVQAEGQGHLSSDSQEFLTLGWAWTWFRPRGRRPHVSREAHHSLPEAPGAMAFSPCIRGSAQRGFLNPSHEPGGPKYQLILLQSGGPKSETSLKVKALAGLVPSGGSKNRIPFPAFFSFWWPPVPPAHGPRPSSKPSTPIPVSLLAKPSLRSEPLASFLK